MGPGKPGWGGIPLHDVSLATTGTTTFILACVPAALVFLPFRVLTGHAPYRFRLAFLLFALGSCLLTAWLWLRILKDNFKNASWVNRGGGLGGAVLAGGQWVLARRISIGSRRFAPGISFLTLTLVSGYIALSSKKPLYWLSLCGLSFGSRRGIAVPRLAWRALGYSGSFIVQRGGFPTKPSARK